MAEPSWPDSVELSAYVSEVQTAQVKLRVPVPVVVLAANLMQQVPRRVGLRNASELVSALLARAAQDPETLADLVGDYREVPVHQILGSDRAEGPLAIPTRDELELS